MLLKSNPSTLVQNYFKLKGYTHASRLMTLPQTACHLGLVADLASDYRTRYIRSPTGAGYGSSTNMTMSQECLSRRSGSTSNMPLLLIVSFTLVCRKGVLRGNEFCL